MKEEERFVQVGWFFMSCHGVAVTRWKADLFLRMPTSYAIRKEKTDVSEDLQWERFSHLLSLVISLQFSYDQKKATFFVQGRSVAAALKRCSRKITMPNGFHVSYLTSLSRCGSYKKKFVTKSSPETEPEQTWHSSFCAENFSAPFNCR